MPASIGAAGKDFQQRFTKLSTAVERGRTDVVKAAALAAKTEHLKVMRRDSGGDLKLSGVGAAKGRRGGAKIGVRYDIKPVGNGARAEVYATGPVPLIANDTSGHVIRSAWSKGKARKGFVGPTFGGQFKGDNRAVLNIPGIGFRRSARHPGTTGKDTWRHGGRVARPKISREMRQTTTTIVKRGFG